MVERAIGRSDDRAVDAPDHPVHPIIRSSNPPDHPIVQSTRSSDRPIHPIVRSTDRLIIRQTKKKCDE
jgi:hypothetical protein